MTSAPAKLVAIHQPNFMPWLGYFDRMIEADLFVLLDHVQFERRNYQNRALIRLEDDTKWLTVPVVQLSQKEKIVDKLVDNPEDTSGNRWWGRRLAGVAATNSSYHNNLLMYCLGPISVVHSRVIASPTSTQRRSIQYPLGIL